MGGKLNFFYLDFMGLQRWDLCSAKIFRNVQIIFLTTTIISMQSMLNVISIKNYKKLFIHNDSIAFYKHDINVVRNKHILRTLSLISIIVGPE